MYMLIGYLALRLGRTEDGAGALEWMSGGGGRMTLVVIHLILARLALTLGTGGNGRSGDPEVIERLERVAAG